MTKVLLIPGNMCDRRLWSPVAEHLSDAGHNVEHAPLLNQNSILDMAEAVLAAASDDPCVVVGFSMGAIVAAEMARIAPEQIEALGLIAYNASSDLPERAVVRPRQQAAVRSGGLPAIVAEELKPHYLAEANRRDAVLLETVMEMALALGPKAFVSQSEALRLRSDQRPELCKMAMPVLLACGSEDRLCPPEWHRTWAGAIGRNARLVEVPSAGHLLPLEQPDALADALQDWLAKEVECLRAS